MKKYLLVLLGCMIFNVSATDTDTNGFSKTTDNFDIQGTDFGIPWLQKPITWSLNGKWDNKIKSALIKALSTNMNFIQEECGGFGILKFELKHSTKWGISDGTNGTISFWIWYKDNRNRYIFACDVTLNSKVLRKKNKKDLQQIMHNLLEQISKGGS